MTFLSCPTTNLLSSGGRRRVICGSGVAATLLAVQASGFQAGGPRPGLRVAGRGQEVPRHPGRPHDKFQLLGLAILFASCIFSGKLNIHDGGPAPPSLPSLSGTHSAGPDWPRLRHRCVEQTIFQVCGGRY